VGRFLFDIGAFLLPFKTMTRSAIAAAVLGAGFFFSLLSPARAQISSYEDEHGKVIYVNGDSQPARRRSTISFTPGPSGTASAQKTLLPNNKGSLSAISQPSEDRMDRIVRDAAARHALDPALVKAVISTESGWNPRAVSSKGAMGLMQLIPGTAQRFGVGNPYDPAQNIEGGTTYLRTLLDRYHGDLTKSLAAYNAGEHAVDQSRGVPSYPETQRYVQKVTNTYLQSDGATGSSFWRPPVSPVRQERDSTGRVVFTNE
jgi:Transglycosylase SLT domain